jgi:hypothetical protein
MIRRKQVLSLGLLALALLAFPRYASGAGPKAMEAVCYVLVEEGNSTEGNSLFLQKMGVEPEILSMVAPTRFSLGPKPSYERQGAFSYEGSTPVLVERRGRFALYLEAITYRAGPFPAVFRTVTVDVAMADLAASRDLVQPAAKAIELAAAKAGIKTGLAWVMSMDMPTRSAIRVKVGLAK